MAETEGPKPPPGVVMVLMHDGRRVCETVDFWPDTWNGFSVKRAQEVRCELALAREYLRMCDLHGDLAVIIEDYEAKRLMRALCEKRGYRIETIFVGHDKDD